MTKAIPIQREYGIVSPNMSHEAYNPNTKEKLVRGYA